MIAIVLFIILLIWILLTKFAMKIGRYLFRRFRPDNPRAEKWGAFWGFMLAMGWVLVYWTVEAVVVRIYAAEMCKQAGITVYVTPEQWRNLTKESADNLRKNAPFHLKSDILGDRIIFDGVEYRFGHKVSDRISEFYSEASRESEKFYVGVARDMFFDHEYKIILFKNTKIGVSTTDGISDISTKPWIDSIPSCFDSSYIDLIQQYSPPTVIIK